MQHSIPVLIRLFISLIHLKSWFVTRYVMPCLGVMSATLTNSVPIGSGIIFTPALAGLNIEGKYNTLAFVSAIQSISNGVFGVLSWLSKDPTIYVWQAFPFTVFPCWVGAAIGITRR